MIIGNGVPYPINPRRLGAAILGTDIDGLRRWNRLGLPKRERKRLLDLKIQYLTAETGGQTRVVIHSLPPFLLATHHFCDFFRPDGPSDEQRAVMRHVREKVWKGEPPEWPWWYGLDQ